MYIVYLDDEKIKTFHDPKSADAYAHYLETHAKSTQKVTIKIKDII